jgi:integrase
MAILSECPVCHTRQAKKNKRCIGWLDKKSGLKCNEDLDAAKKAKKLLNGGSNRRNRVLNHGEYNKLYSALPSHTAPIVAAAFWTGMRRGEILGLTWDKVDLKKRMLHLEPSDTKEGLAKKVPISKTLRNILKNLPRGLHNDYVFLFKGRPIRDIRDGRMRGCKDAGIPYGRKAKNGFTFHDLRHTAKTMMRKAGVDKNVRAVIFGHSNGGDMDFRYDHVDESDLLEAIDRTERYMENVSQSVSNRVKKEPAEASLK